jgi:hypothetical protein
MHIHVFHGIRQHPNMVLNFRAHAGVALAVKTGWRLPVHARQCQVWRSFRWCAFELSAGGVVVWVVGAIVGVGG